MKNEIHRNGLSKIKRFNFGKRSSRGKIHVSDHQLTNALKVLRAQENNTPITNHDNSKDEHGSNYHYQYGRNIPNGVNFNVNLPRNGQYHIKETDQDTENAINMTKNTSINYSHFNTNSTAFVYNKFNTPNGKNMNRNQYSLTNDQFAQEKIKASKGTTHNESSNDKCDSQKKQNNDAHKVLTISTMINKYNVEEEMHKKKILTNMLAYEIGCQQAMKDKGMKIGQNLNTGHVFPTTAQNIIDNRNRLKIVTGMGKECDNNNFFTNYSNDFENSKKKKWIDILQVNINLGKEIKCIKVHWNDDYYLKAKSFCEENSLPEKLVRPISFKIMHTISSIHKMFNMQLNEEEIDHFRNIKSIYFHAYRKSSHSYCQSGGQRQNRNNSCESGTSNEIEEKASKKSFSC